MPSGVYIRTERTEKHKKNLSIALKGRIAWNIGKIGVQKHSKETRKKISESHKGENHWQWKGGITALHNKIRCLLENKQWIAQIFRRDYWTCQKCYRKGKKINAHHIKPFAELLSIFLKKHDQFSPVEDKETLLRLAMKHKPFWNINNGKTLCEDCHKFINALKK